MDLPHGKIATFLGNEFSCEWNGQHYFILHRKKDILPIYQMMPLMLDESPSLAVELQSSALLRLCV